MTNMEKWGMTTATYDVDLGDAVREERAAMHKRLTEMASKLALEHEEWLRGHPKPWLPPPAWKAP